MNNTTNAQVDRTFLYLVAIYVIHGILLHVVLMYPQFHGAEINWSIATIDIQNDRNGPIAFWNSNDSKTEKFNISFDSIDRTTKWSDVNSDHNHLHQETIMTNELLYQTKFRSSATGHTVGTSVVEVMSCGSAMLKNISPAVLGIILGCMVFLFTDNINVP